MKKTIILVLSFILVLGAGIIIGIYIPDQSLSDNNITEEEHNNDDTKEEENNNNVIIVENQNAENNVSKYSEEYFHKIITTQLGALFNKKNLDELTNQERLDLLITEYKEQNENREYDDAIKVQDLRKIHENSIIKNLKVNYVDIYDSENKFVSDNDPDAAVLYKYNPEKDEYTYAHPGGHGGYTLAAVVYRELISFEKENNTYTIKYKYVFGNVMGEGPWPYDLYYTGIDAYNEKNSFKTVDTYRCTDEYCNDFKTPALEYIDENYDTIQNKLSTYTFTFKKENKQLAITSFSVE